MRKLTPLIKNSLSDEELVEKVRIENSELYVEIVKRHQQKLYRYLNYLTNNSPEAEDLVQNVFIKTYQNLFDFNTKRKFSSWIYLIAHNEGINFIRNRKRKKQISLEDLNSPLVDNNNFFNDNLIGKEIQRKVKQCLDELEPKYSEPLILYYFEDKSYKEISDILRIPIKTVGTFIFRGKKIMKDICQKRGINLPL